MTNLKFPSVISSKALTLTPPIGHAVYAMSSFRIRPHFVHEESRTTSDFQNAIVKHIDEDEPGILIKTFPDYLTLVIPDEDQHFWSPQLNLSLEPTETGNTQITGTYGPNTNVWSMFLYGYLTGFCLTGFCLAGVSTVFAISKWVVSGWTFGFYFMGFFFAVLTGLYITAQIGQKLAAQQTFQLHQAYERAIGKSIVVH